MRRGVLILGALIAAAGCAGAPPIVEGETEATTPVAVDPAAESEAAHERAVERQEAQDFLDGVLELQATFGSEEKADLISRATVCELIAPVAKYGDALIKSGFVLGIEGTAVVGPLDMFGGYDLVWDLYHQQFSVSRFGGSIRSLDELAVTATAYVGFAAGFQTGVQDWYGYHAAVSLEVGLPYMDDFFSFELTAFRSAVDQNGDGVADATEVLMPPDGVFGYTVGITAGIDAFPDPLPVEITLSEGYWEPHKHVTRTFFDRFQEATFLGFEVPIAARLVDTADGSVCPEDWPWAEDERDCVIELGKPDSSHTRRALHLARSLCTATHGCAMPLTWPLAAAALAIGKLRDAGLTPSDLCPGVVDQAYQG